MDKKKNVLGSFPRAFSGFQTFGEKMAAEDEKLRAAARRMLEFTQATMISIEDLRHQPEKEDIMAAYCREELGL